MGGTFFKSLDAILNQFFFRLDSRNFTSMQIENYRQNTVPQQI